jgi:pimeloyl-ACP methyl ester carboxylesterase
MQLVQKGRGVPLILVPGLQGRWEYARATVSALAEHFRIITFALCDEPAARFPFVPARALDSYADQLLAAIDVSGHQRAIVCGISFGGLIALRFAAEHPDRVDALVLASTPGPGTHLQRRHRLYVRFPRLLGPLFVIETPFRLRREISAALPGLRERWALLRDLVWTPILAPISFSRMAARALVIGSYSASDASADCARLAAPTLVITGEPGLDHVVPVDAAAGYAKLIPDAELAVLERTGHVGSITRPEAFATIVADFIRRKNHAAA